MNFDPSAFLAGAATFVLILGLLIVCGMACNGRVKTDKWDDDEPE
jgi:hypothetical protein